MAEVHGGAFFTISAASASSINEGILFERENPVLSSVELVLESNTNPRIRGKILVSPAYRFKDSLDEPLYRRGWALQERILSPRVLIWNRDQFAWECQSCSVTESGVEMEMIGAMRLNTTYAPDEDSSYKSHADAWQYIVAGYSARLLTRSSDKLPTMSHGP
jgi:hypothetical protein